MLVLGVDPGVGATGYGMVARTDGVLRAVEYGSIITTPGDPFPFRLQQIFSRLAELIRCYQPEWAAVESLIFAKNVQSAFKLGQARGVAMLAATLSGVTIAEYSPLQIKSAVTGYGAAGKPQVQQMVQSLLSLGEPIRSTDAADALAVAICHHHSARLLHLTRGRGR